MISEDCLNVRLADYLERRRRPGSEPEAEQAEEERDAPLEDAEEERG